MLINQDKLELLRKLPDKDIADIIRQLAGSIDSEIHPLCLSLMEQIRQDNEAIEEKKRKNAERQRRHREKSNALSHPSNAEVTPCNTDVTQSNAQQALLNESVTPPPPKRRRRKEDAEPKNYAYSQEDIEFAQVMVDGILEISPHIKINVDETADTIRKMRELDRIDLATIKSVWQWAHNDVRFWRKNILSASKLRAQFGNLEARMGGKKVDFAAAMMENL